jgi:hypothetical protein
LGAVVLLVIAFKSEPNRSRRKVPARFINGVRR